MNPSPEPPAPEDAVPTRAPLAAKPLGHSAPVLTGPSAEQSLFDMSLDEFVDTMEGKETAPGISPSQARFRWFMRPRVAKPSPARTSLLGACG